jgi:ribosome maturation factor RimP
LGAGDPAPAPATGGKSRPVGLVAAAPGFRVYYAPVDIEARGSRASLLSEPTTITTYSLTEAFERALHALTLERDFRNIEIVTTRARRHGRATAFTVVIDAPGGADLALCERIAARINAALDERPEPYTLEVESPGLDRPLTKPADYERFRGARVRVLTTLAVNGAKTHRGTVSGLKGNVLVLATETGELPLPLEMVRAANLDVDIRADLARAKQERRRS